MSVALITVGLAATLSGCVAAALGWLPPWLSGHVARPRAWGIGMVGIGLFTLAQVPSLRERITDAGSVVSAVPFVVLVAGLAGLALSGGRPGRRPAR
ncbi:hypothetical protein ACFU6I_19825 [Streptomyces sp. NPDC057486]|uniref:hypothetical protein n=1 Tax=Streptomyces sp. NPDC057486 TaxID=3346145 RepID=UPI0036AFA1F8